MEVMLMGKRVALVDGDTKFVNVFKKLFTSK
jgi:hypothetical protein